MLEIAISKHLDTQVLIKLIPDKFYIVADRISLIKIILSNINYLGSDYIDLYNKIMDNVSRSDVNFLTDSDFICECMRKEHKFLNESPTEELMDSYKIIPLVPSNITVRDLYDCTKQHNCSVIYNFAMKAIKNNYKEGDFISNDDHSIVAFINIAIRASNISKKQDPSTLFYNYYTEDVIKEISKDYYTLRELVSSCAKSNISKVLDTITNLKLSSKLGARDVIDCLKSDKCNI